MPYDALIAPTTDAAGGTASAHCRRIRRRAPTKSTGWIAFTFPFNSTGQPAISIPNGFSKSGLPLALQIVGRPGDEAGIIALAAEFKRARRGRTSILRFDR